jgi:hypothetical protein
MKGLDGLDGDNQVEGNIDDPAIAEQYRLIEAKRGYSYSERPHLSTQCNATPAKTQETAPCVAMSDTEVNQDAGTGRHVAWSRKDLEGM